MILYKLIQILSIGSSPSGCVMDCYPPHPGFIPISDMIKLQASIEFGLLWVPSSK
jgi:hypothetical protein